MWAGEEARPSPDTVSVRQDVLDVLAVLASAIFRVGLVPVLHPALEKLLLLLLCLVRTSGSMFSYLLKAHLANLGIAEVCSKPRFVSLLLCVHVHSLSIG